MNKRFWVIIGVLAVAFMGFIGLARIQKGDAPIDYSRYQRAAIQKMAKSIDYGQYDPGTIIAPDENTGGLPEKIYGNSEAAVVIFEYADYACSHCAEHNFTVNKLVEDYGDKVAVVFRGFVLNFPNSVITASAANAAAIQGCWKEYKDLLFANQAEWFYMRGAELEDYLAECFEKASGGAGDAQKFKEDMKSEAVAKRVAFDYGLGEKVGLTGTPMFMIDGKAVNPIDLRATVKRKLGA